MFEIVLLIVAAGGIAAYARGRGGNAILWGSIGVGGYAIVNYIVPMIMVSFGRSLDPDSRMWLFFAAVAWVGIVAFCARFLLGSTRERPSGMWSCTNCKYLNQQYAVICEACQKPYRSKAIPAS
jgi:nitrate/nitrite transporter NarK